MTEQLTNDQLQELYITDPGAAMLNDPRFAQAIDQRAAQIAAAAIGPMQQQLLHQQVAAKYGAERADELMKAAAESHKQLSGSDPVSQAMKLIELENHVLENRKLAGEVATLKAAPPAVPAKPGADYVAFAQTHGAPPPTPEQAQHMQDAKAREAAHMKKLLGGGQPRRPIVKG
jgi:hypothetical protein